MSVEEGAASLVRWTGTTRVELLEDVLMDGSTVGRGNGVKIWKECRVGRDGEASTIV